MSDVNFVNLNEVDSPIPTLPPFSTAEFGVASFPSFPSESRSPLLKGKARVTQAQLLLLNSLCQTELLVPKIEAKYGQRSELLARRMAREYLKSNQDMNPFPFLPGNSIPGVESLLVEELSPSLVLEPQYLTGNGNSLAVVHTKDATLLLFATGACQNCLAVSEWVNGSVSTAKLQVEVSNLPLAFVAAKRKSSTMILAAAASPNTVSFFLLATSPSYRLDPIGRIQLAGDLVSLVLSDQEPFQCAIATRGSVGRVILWREETVDTVSLRSGLLWVAVCTVFSKLYCCTPDTLYYYDMRKELDEPLQVLSFGELYGEGIALLRPTYLTFGFFLLTRTHLLIFDGRVPSRPHLTWRLPAEISRRSFLSSSGDSNGAQVFVVDKTNSTILAYFFDSSFRTLRSPLRFSPDFVATNPPHMMINSLAGFAALTGTNHIATIQLTESSDLWSQHIALDSSQNAVPLSALSFTLFQRNLTPHPPAWLRKFKTSNFSSWFGDLVSTADSSPSTLTEVWVLAQKELALLYQTYNLPLDSTSLAKHFARQHPSRAQPTISGQVAWAAFKRPGISEVRLYRTRFSCRVDRGPVKVKVDFKRQRLRCINLLTGAKSHTPLASLYTDPCIAPRLALEEREGALPTPNCLLTYATAHFFEANGLLSPTRARMVSDQYFRVPCLAPCARNDGMFAQTAEPSQILDCLQKPQTVHELSAHLGIDEGALSAALSSLCTEGLCVRKNLQFPGCAELPQSLTTVYQSLPSLPSSVGSQATQDVSAPLPQLTANAQNLVDRWHSSRSKISGETPRLARADSAPLSAPLLRSRSAAWPEESTPLAAPRLVPTPAKKQMNPVRKLKL